MKLLNRFLCVVLSFFILFSFVFSDLVQASDFENADPTYVLPEGNIQESCYEEYETPVEEPVNPAPPTGPLVPTPSLPGIPLDPVKPPLVTHSVTTQTITVDPLLEDGCDYQDVYVDFVEYTNSISYIGTAPGYASDIAGETIGGADTQALPFILPVLYPVVTRYAGQLVVKQFLKNSTKNIVIRNGHLAGKRHSVTGVLFSNQGFPIFKEKFAVTLSNSLLKSSNDIQFSAANKVLRNKIQTSATLRNQFSSAQLTDIRNGKKPRGLTWHHHEIRGRMELVDSWQHSKTGHTGGRAIWGTNYATK